MNLTTPIDRRLALQLAGAGLSGALALPGALKDPQLVAKKTVEEFHGLRIGLASYSTRTSRIRLGTAVLLTPFYNPVRLAEDLAVLDLLSEGRVDLTAGSASITREFETFGVEAKERFGRK